MLKVHAAYLQGSKSRDLSLLSGIEAVMWKRKQLEALNFRKQEADAEATLDFLWKQEAEAVLKHCFRFHFCLEYGEHFFIVDVVECGLLISRIGDVAYQECAKKNW